MAGYIGREPFSTATQSRGAFTATSGQTSFSFDYDAGFLDVYVNGLKISSDDFTASNGSTVVFDTGLTTGDVVAMLSLSSFEVGDTYSKSEADTLLATKTTETYVTTQIDNLVGSAPGALDTLQELGDALGDDANFASTVTTSLAGKVDDSQVLTDVPASAVFTDTTYSVGDGGLTTKDFTTALNTKLGGIESGATTDQTNAEIKTAYEANANSNEFSDAEQTKLSGIETSATADQTNAEIKTAYEANADTNEFSDTEQTKLSGIEASADVTDTTNVVASLTAGTNVAIAADGTVSSTDTDTVYTHPTGAGNKHVPTGGSTGQLLTNTASGTGTWQDAPVSLPTQTSHSGKYLGTDGSAASWSVVESGMAYTEASAAPTGPTNGDLWLDTDDEILYQYQTGAWIQVSDDGSIQGLGNLTTKGDLEVFGTTQGRLPVGTNGQVLKADSTAATGVAWGTVEGVPSGVITMWSGSASAIPSGWNLCDGNNGTPNLVGKFIKGGSTAGTTGGSTSHSHSHTLSAGAHTLSTAQMPSHSHSSGVKGQSLYTSSGYVAIYSGTHAASGYIGTGSAGSSSSHSHSLSGSVSNGNHEPPYYTICYIMKT